MKDLTNSQDVLQVTNGGFAPVVIAWGIGFAAGLYYGSKIAKDCE